MVSNYLVKFLEEKEVPTITKKRHTYLTYYGLEQQDTYVLKEGIVKTSIILRDGREFNISYIKGPDIISLTEAIFRQQLMTMNGKNGAVCAFIYQLIPIFGRKVKKGILIDFQVTNDDIAGFCGISTRNSVNRILRGLREQNVISMVYQKILILDVDYLKQFVQA